MKTIKEINKLFDEKFGLDKDMKKSDSDFADFLKDIKSFYTQQILSLIEELEGKIPKEDEGYFSMGCEEEARIRGFNEAVDQMRASIKELKGKI